MKDPSYPGRFSAVKRVFFAPVDQRKFEQLRDRTQQDLMQINWYNIR